MNFKSQAERVIQLLESGVPVATCYPLLRELEPMRAAEHGPSSWPGCLVRMSDDGGRELATSIPGIDYFHSAILPESMSPDEENEIREHLILVLREWCLAEPTTVIPKYESLPVVNLEENELIYNGKTYADLDQDALLLFDLLVRHHPRQVSVKIHLPDVRVHRIKQSLPKELAELIDSGRGKPGTSLKFKQPKQGPKTHLSP